MPEISILNDDSGRTVVQPRLELIVEERCGNDAGLRFPPTHGDACITAVAGDDFPLGAEQRVLGARQINMGAGCGVRAGDDFVPLEIVKGFDWRRVPYDMDGYTCGRSSNVIELRGIIAYAVSSDHLLRGK